MIINTVEGLTKLAEELKKEGNLLYPLTFCDSIAPMHRVSVRRLTIDSNPDNGEVYHPKQVGQGKFALTKLALLKLDLAAGLDWDYSCRTDDKKDPFFVTWEAVAYITDLDGSRRRVRGEGSCDYRDGSIQIEGLSAGDIKQRRMSIIQRAETAAKNRARRDAVGLKPTYTVSQLQKPFIVLKLVQDLPARYNDAIAAKMIGVDQAIFGTKSEYVDLSQSQPEELTEKEPDQTAPLTKEEVVDAINKLYIEKLGSPRPTSRTPLTDLSLEQLQEVMEKLISMEKK